LIGLGRGSEVGRFQTLLELIELALEGALSGGFIAQQEVVVLYLLVSPIVSIDAAGGAEEIVEVALVADAVPLGLGGFENEIVGDGIVSGVVALRPAGE